ncbi:flavin-containing monooxygenase [Alteromonas flava]|uniref:flavin-containing monooxygenase n=1 Tax=Alteromonas flava TaxID=2048003 RepID=UPI000C283FF2|nr:NAD(P)/FAD-dependent oxidoreductase [Alteromonas flava]
MESNVLTAVVIGSGFGGQTAAIHLLRHKISDFVILERRSFTGGTWKQNTYPGAAVDVQSLLYSLSFEPYDWSRMFAEQQELAAYTDYIYTRYQLQKKTLCSANVSQLKWLEDRCVWEVTVNESETLYAQYVINASGPLSMPVIPNFPGQETFAGPTFHTNDWEHSVDLKNKKVAIIGSGASAAQVIPAIVDDVDCLYVFQRTPHWVLPRWDIQFSKWQRKLLNIGWIYKLMRVAIYWLLEIRILGFKYSRKMLDIIGKRPALKHLRKQIRDPQLRQKLTPDFTIGCKRVIVSSSYYPAIAHPNSQLYDRTNGINEIMPNAIKTVRGDVLATDVIIYATGFDATDGLVPYPVIGKGGQTLQEFWHEYPRAYLGTCVPQCPNFFLVTGPNTGIGHTSALFIIESQMNYIFDAIQYAQQNDARGICVTPEAEANYTAMIHKEMANTVWQTGGCHSWYKSISGKVTAMFPGFSFTYRRLTKRFKVIHHKLIS